MWGLLFVCTTITHLLVIGKVRSSLYTYVVYKLYHFVEVNVNHVAYYASVRI